MSNNKTNPNEAITAIVETSSSPYGDSRMECSSVGLTKREYFAAMAMQGICSNTNNRFLPREVAEVSVRIADELIKTLNNEQQ